MISRNQGLLAFVLLTAACAAKSPASAPAVDTSTTAPQAAPSNPTMPAGEHQMDGHSNGQGHTPGAAATGTQPGTPPASPTADPHAGHNMQDSPAKTVYECPMHPEVTSPKPGKCPKCGMNLTLKK